MKKVLILLFIAPSFLFSQIEKSKSKIEELSSKSGVLLKKEYKPIATITGAYGTSFKMQVLKITDLKTNVTTAGLKFDYQKSSFFLDKDEINGLYESLVKMREINDTPQPLEYTEFNFYSNTGLRIGLFSSDKEGTWQLLIDFSKYSSINTTNVIFFEATKIKEALDLLLKNLSEVKKVI
jgi:hypothetical protein